MRSVTVSYRSEGMPLFTTRVGYGNTVGEALEDADRQLADGVWRRLSVSNPQSIITDMQVTKKALSARGTLLRGENVLIRVERCVSQVLEVN